MELLAKIELVNNDPRVLLVNPYTTRGIQFCICQLFKIMFKLITNQF